MNGNKRIVGSDSMKNLNELLEEYRADSLSGPDKGIRFEVLMKNFLLTYEPYREKIF